VGGEIKEGSAQPVVNFALSGQFILITWASSVEGDLRLTSSGGKENTIMDFEVESMGPFSERVLELLGRREAGFWGPTPYVKCSLKRR